MEQYETMIELGIGVHKVADLYEKDQHGDPIPVAEREMWCVSVLSDSPLSETVGDIPLSDTECEAWQRAARHYEAQIAALQNISTDSIDDYQHPD